jgi:YidC/Oxa1 family membrane protein insertase
MCLFTLATKVILFPLSLLAQVNAVAMVRIKPRLDEIKRRFEGNSRQILAEQKKLHQREHYSSLKGVAPMLIQIPIILGLINVVYKPLQHLLHLPSHEIRALVERTAELLGTTTHDLGYSAQLQAMAQVQADPAAYATVAATPPGVTRDGIGQAINQIQMIDMTFLGMDLAQTPSWGHITLVWPAASAISALALCLFQNRYYILNRVQSGAANLAMTVFMVAFSGYFALVLPCALGLYWTLGNLASIAVVWLCNLIYRPERHLGGAAVPEPVRKTSRERQEARRERATDRARSREDAKRFASTPSKQLVFYSEGSGYWKYFRRLVAYLLEHTDLVVHYVTSDRSDQVFKLNHGRFRPYYISQRALISFMMKLNSDIVVMTLPDLENFHIQRSLVRRDAEYIYVDHGMTSFHLMLREHALDHFDTIFAYGPNHIDEIRQAERLAGLGPKRIVVTGYGLLDDLLESVEELGQTAPNSPPIALVAPSWQVDNLVELCLAETVDPLVEAGFKVVVRPHPEFVKRFKDKTAAVGQSLAHHIESGAVEYQTDFSSNSTVYSSDLVVTDWSSIAQEFSYATKKPSIFINTPMKVMNPNWRRLDTPPLDITLRDMIGVSLDVEELSRIGQVAADLLSQAPDWKRRIDRVLQDNIYFVGRSEQAAGAYLVEAAARFASQRGAASPAPA